MGGHRGGTSSLPLLSWKPVLVVQILWVPSSSLTLWLSTPLVGAHRLGAEPLWRTSLLTPKQFTNSSKREAGRSPFPKCLFWKEFLASACFSIASDWMGRCPDRQWFRESDGWTQSIGTPCQFSDFPRQPPLKVQITACSKVIPACVVPRSSRPCHPLNSGIGSIQWIVWVQAGVPQTADLWCRLACTSEYTPNCGTMWYLYLLSWPVSGSSWQRSFFLLHCFHSAFI